MLSKPAEIEADFVKKAAEVLFEGKPAYDPRIGLSKEEITKEILELKHALADPKNSKSDGLSSGDPQAIKETVKLFEDRIKILENMYKNAPDKIECICQPKSGPLNQPKTGPLFSIQLLSFFEPVTISAHI